MLHGENADLLLAAIGNPPSEQAHRGMQTSATDFSFNMPYIGPPAPQSNDPGPSHDRLHYELCGGGMTNDLQRPSNLALTTDDSGGGGDETTDYSEQEQSPPQPERVKRPMNAFMVWAKEERARLSAERSHKHNADLSRLLGQRWRAMSETEKEPYRQQAQVLAQRHKREHPEYRYRPRRRQSGEKKVRGRRINSEDLSRVKAALSKEQLSAYMARGGLRREQRSQSSASITSLTSNGESASSSGTVQNASWDDLRLLADSVDAESVRMSNLAHATLLQAPAVGRIVVQSGLTLRTHPSGNLRVLPSCVNDRKAQLLQSPPPLIDEGVAVKGETNESHWYTVNNTVPLSPCPSTLDQSRQPTALTPVTPSHLSPPCTPVEHHQPPRLIETNICSPTSGMPPPLETTRNAPQLAVPTNPVPAQLQNGQPYTPWLNHSW